MPKVVKRSEKIWVYCLFVFFDLIQIIFDALVLPEGLNHFLDFIIGGILFAYGQKKKLWTGQKLLILLATFVVEQIPFVNALPFWTLDVRNLYSGTISKAPPEQNPNEQAHLNKDGTRLPSGRPKSFYKDGVGAVRE